MSKDKSSDMDDILREKGPDAARAFRDSAKLYRPKPEPKPEPVSKPPPAPPISNDAPPEEQEFITEDALALRFSERHADELRYIALKSEWRKWNGSRWQPDATLLAFDLARRCCRAVAAELCPGKPLKHIFNAKTFAAVERMAKADRRHATTINQWDANDLDFNTMENPNGYVQP